MAALVDQASVVHDFLSADAALVSQVGGRLYSDTDYPPPDYRPEDGPAVCWKVRGSAGGAGQAIATQERTGTLAASIQFRIYGMDRAAADLAYRTLWDALDQKGGGTLRWAIMEGPGQPLLTPDPNQWPFVLVFFTVYLANS